MKKRHLIISLLIYLFIVHLCTLDIANAQGEQTIDIDGNHSLVVHGRWGSALHPRQRAAESTYLEDARIEPIVYKQGIETFSLMLKVKDPDIISVRMTLGGFITYQGEDLRNPTLEFFDDGTHGDAIAEDNVFTLNELATSESFDRPLGGKNFVFRNVDLTFIFAGGREKTSKELDNTPLWINPSIVDIPPVIRVAEDVQRTDHIVNIVMDFEGEFPNYFVNEKDLANRYYEIFEDDRDFLIYVYPFSTGIPATGTYRTIINNVEGIGASIIDISSDFGSSGTLQGQISIYRHAESLSTLNHEIMHRFAAYLDAALDITSGPHWSVTEMESSGFCGGIQVTDIEQVSSGIYRTWRNDSYSCKYNKLEQYLMGLASIDEVQFPIRTLINPSNPETVEDNGQFFTQWQADGIRVVTKNEFLTVQGERVPSFPNTQKNFTAAIIIIYDRPLNDVEMAYFDFAASEYEKMTSLLNTSPNLLATFFEATEGKATLSTKLNDFIPTSFPDIPILYEPLDNTNNVKVPTILRWNLAKQAESYDLQVSRTSSFGTSDIVVDIDDLRTAHYTLTNLDPQTTYYWRVKAQNALGTSNWSSRWSFRTRAVAPTTPLLASPENGAVDQPSTVTFVWNEVPNADRYNLQVATNSNFTTLIFGDSTLTQTQQDVGPLEYSTTHYWRVRAKNAGGIGPWSEMRSFTTMRSNSAPIVSSAIPDTTLLVGGDSLIQDLSVVFSDADEDTLSYSAESSDEMVAAASITESTLTVRALALGSATITVTADDGRGGRATTSFEVSVPTVVAVERVGDGLPKKFALGQNYPNPFNPMTTITFDLPQSSSITLKVYDMLGREVAVLRSGHFPAGHFEALWDATGFSSGVYVYRLEAGTYSETKKLILQK